MKNISKKYFLFGMKLYLDFRKNYACNLKNGRYNADIESNGERKKMKNVKMKMVEMIANLQNEMNHYRQLRQFGKVAEIRLEIARLQAILGETY